MGFALFVAQTKRSRLQHFRYIFSRHRFTVQNSDDITECGVRVAMHGQDFTPVCSSIVVQSPCLARRKVPAKML